MKFMYYLAATNKDLFSFTREKRSLREALAGKHIYHDGTLTALKVVRLDKTGRLLKVRFSSSSTLGKSPSNSPETSHEGSRFKECVSSSMNHQYGGPAVNTLAIKIGLTFHETQFICNN
jgi:hypothetical protein